MTRTRLRYLLNRYLNNTATEEELQAYADWYRRQGEEGVQLFDDVDGKAAAAYKSELFQAIISDIQFTEYEEKQRDRKWRSLYIKITSAALVVIIGTLVLYYGLSTGKPTIAAHPETVNPVSTAPVIAIRNHTGISTPVYLPDGSEVQLFTGSELRYEAPFAPTHRHIYLSGKAFFKVAKDTARPFTVYSHDIATTALGTSFTITAWRNRNDISVALHTGKVVVQHLATANARHMKDVYLVAGQQVTCNIATGAATLHQPEMAKAKTLSLGSRTGLADTFTDEPMVNVLGAIEKGYAVHLQYDKNALAEMVFTGRIREKDSLSQVLNRLSILYNLTITKTGNRFVIQQSH